MLNSALLAPGGIVTDTGTVAAEVALLESFTTVPVDGAGPLSVTVPLRAVPPRIDAGFKLRDASIAGVTVRCVLLLLEPRDPVIVATVVPDTPIVVTANDAVFEPVGTVTEDGTIALALLEVSVTIVPPDGAKPLTVTVPEDDVPPTTEDGDTKTDVTVGTGSIVSVAVTDAAPSAAVITAGVTVVTGLVEIVKVVLVEPAATIMLDGTTALLAPEDSAITVPPTGEGPVRVTVPVNEAPPMTEVGDTETPATVKTLLKELRDITAISLVGPTVLPYAKSVLSGETAIEVNPLMLKKPTEPDVDVSNACRLLLVLA